MHACGTCPLVCARTGCNGRRQGRHRSHAQPPGSGACHAPRHACTAEGVGAANAFAYPRRSWLDRRHVRAAVVRPSACVHARFAHAGIPRALQSDGRAARTAGVPAQPQPTAQQATKGKSTVPMPTHAAGAAAARVSCHLPMAPARERTHTTHRLLAPALGHTHSLMHAHTHTHAQTHTQPHTLDHATRTNHTMQIPQPKTVPRCKLSPQCRAPVRRRRRHRARSHRHVSRATWHTDTRRRM